jgi:hypothetical protein
MTLKLTILALLLAAMMQSCGVNNPEDPGETQTNVSSPVIITGDFKSCEKDSVYLIIRFSPTASFGEMQIRNNDNSPWIECYEFTGLINEWHYGLGFIKVSDPLDFLISRNYSYKIILW